MKLIGKITKYDGRFGKIETENHSCDFSHKDLFSQDAKIGDFVEFRLEYREPQLLLAKNIRKLNIPQND